MVTVGMMVGRHPWRGLVRVKACGLIAYNSAMSPAYQPSPGPTDGEADHDHRWSIRRHRDRCFHAAEEFVPGRGYVVQGVLIPLEEIAQVREQAKAPACERPAAGPDAS
jgi:hypothetical protein